MKNIKIKINTSKYKRTWLNWTNCFWKHKWAQIFLVNTYFPYCLKCMKNALHFHLNYVWLTKIYDCTRSSVLKTGHKTVLAFCPGTSVFYPVLVNDVNWCKEWKHPTMTFRIYFVIYSKYNIQKPFRLPFYIL